VITFADGICILVLLFRTRSTKIGPKLASIELLEISVVPTE